MTGDALPPVVADAVLIEQVVANLVRNACDALSHQAQPRRVCIAVEASKPGWVQVRVQDNGPGLGGQTATHLCEPFFTTKSEGMGMGLAICRSIIELHYGALEAHDAPEGGAVFSFNLPTHLDEEEAT